MFLHTAGVMSAALVAGLAGSLAAYRSQVAEDLAVDRPAAVATSHAPQPAKSGTRFRWAPCPKGSRLDGGVCVIDVVRTVVVPVAPVHVPAPVVSGAAAATGHEDNDDEGYDDHDDDEHDEAEHDEAEHDQGDDADDD